MEYEERERLKEEGWKLFSESKTSHGKAGAIMRFVVLAHYYRAVENLKKSQIKKIVGKKYVPGYELDIDDYSRHWLFSMKDHFQSDVFEALCEWYEPEECKFLPKGCTCYRF